MGERLHGRGGDEKNSNRRYHTTIGEIKGTGKKGALMYRRKKGNENMWCPITSAGGGAEKER